MHGGVIIAFLWRCFTVSVLDIFGVDTCDVFDGLVNYLTRLRGVDKSSHVYIRRVHCAIALGSSPAAAQMYRK